MRDDERDKDEISSEELHGGCGMSGAAQRMRECIQRRVAVFIVASRCLFGTLPLSVTTESTRKKKREADCVERAQVEMNKNKEKE